MRRRPVRDADDRRAWMVDHDLRRRGITDEAVLAAMAHVPRERFVAERLADAAYGDQALPIDEGQTISQPFVVALMAQAAEVGPADRVLEIGCGSGYGAAVLGEVATTVVSVERHERLAAQARARLQALGYDNVSVAVGDGSLGRPGEGPFDAIIVTAGAPAVPPALVEQLADGGRLVVPVGRDRHDQRLLRVRRRGPDVAQEDLGAVRFVPLVGEQGW